MTGPSGSGKSELIGALLELYPDHCTMWQQFTTRPRRGPGDRYVFVTPEKFNGLRPLLTVRTTFGGNHYGTMPEAGAEGKAVLTIADVNGYADLARSVEEHNRNLALNRTEPLIGGLGRPTPLGRGPVNLFTVLVRYAPTEESVEARGRGPRGLAFVQAELDGLADFKANLTIDTTEKWPDPTEFFEQHVWPLISPPDWVALARGELAAAGELLEAHGGDVAEDIHSMLSAWREEFLRAPSPSALAAMGATELAALPLAEIQAQFDALAPPEVERTPLEVEPRAPLAAPDDPTDAALAEAADALGPPAAEESPGDRLARMEAEIKAAGPEAPPPFVEPEAAQAEPEAAPPPPVASTGPRFRTLRDLIAGSDFEGFIIRTRTGQTGFSSHSYFEAMFRRYMTESGAVFPGRLDFGRPPVEMDPGDPKKQAKIRRFEVKHNYNGQEEIFLIGYSERLLRPESGGRVIGSVNLNS
jgi:hypothetical protein